VRIAVADARRANLDKRLAGPSGWFVNVFVDERRFESSQTNSVHRLSSLAVGTASSLHFK
jgi:hypothetical protein